MTERSFLQELMAEAVGFFEFVGTAIGDPRAKAAIVRDLGGSSDGAAIELGTLPEPALETIRAYRDGVAEELGSEALASALPDLLALIDAVISIGESIAPTFPTLVADDASVAERSRAIEELGHAVLELLTTNYVRLRRPRLFFVLEAAAGLEELDSAYGGGAGERVPFWSSLKSIGRFVWSPGRTLAALDKEVPETGRWDKGVDLGHRLAAVAAAFTAQTKGLDVLDDQLHGWDAPGVDVDSHKRPTRTDLVSGGMTSLALVHRGTAGGARLEEQLQLSLAYIPKAHGGRYVFAALGGAMRVEAPVGERWTYTLDARADAPATALIGGPEGFFVGDGTGGDRDDPFILGASIGSRPGAASGLSFAVPTPTGTRLEIGRLVFSLDANDSALEATLHVADAALVIDSADHDGLVRKLLGGVPLRLPFELLVGHSTRRGLVLEGRVLTRASPSSGRPNAPLAGSGDTAGAPVVAATIPLGRAYGPVTLHEMALRVAIGPPGSALRDAETLSIAADVSFSARLGPVHLGVERLGLGLTLDGRAPRRKRNLRVIDAHLGAAPPSGVAVEIDSDIISGSGTIHFDEARGLYFGTLALKLEGGVTLKGMALIGTRDRAGRANTSILVTGTLENLDWPVGPDVTVRGIGVIVGIDREFDEAAAREALPSGKLRDVLFPRDPVGRSAAIIDALGTFFPMRAGSHMIGLLAKLTYGRNPTLVNLDVALIYAWGKSHRLILLGRLWSLLPTEKSAVLKIYLDAVGVLDLGAGTVALDAVLLPDSRLCGRFALTGSAALRGSDDVGGFVLAVGGLHPAYPHPAGLPRLDRLTLALTTGKNPKLVCEAYFAITANTLQFGARASLYAAAHGFSIEGSVEFHALIQHLPFHYLAEFAASVQLKRGSRNLFMVRVEGALEGPLPLRVRGKATFGILCWDYSISFDKTLVSGSTPSEVPLIDALAALRDALADGGSWRAELPRGAREQVVVRADGDGGVLLHPMGSLSVSQRIVPLNLSRDIDRVGTARPTGARRFAVARVVLGEAEQSVRAVHALFAPAQLFDMSDDEKLAAPSFEEMQAGISFGTEGYAFDMGSRRSSAFDYTDIVIGADGTPRVKEEPRRLDLATLKRMLQVGPAGSARLRREAPTRFAAPQSGVAPRVRPIGWAAVAPGQTAPPTVLPTWVEAQGRRVRAAAPRTLVPSTELAPERE